MKATISAFLMVLVVNVAAAQRPQYSITATLDTANHTITGTIDIMYTNRSSSTLDKLGIHLWPNAYSTKNTDLVKQMLELGDFSLYKAHANDLGGLFGLNFTSKGQQIDLKTNKDFIDMGWLMLPNPLTPDSSIEISSPFTLKVPLTFSRMGRTGNAYQITQWYPHIAVFDEDGWHMMPYLDQGEFYNDFADYDVHLYVPPGFKIAATGVLLSKTEENKLTGWNFKAENVIDFAWFANPSFRQVSYLVDVGSERKVELELYFVSSDSSLLNRAGDYAQRALKFYSEWLGPYPYPKMSVVTAPMGAGGGMEYPMVAQIGFSAGSVLLDIIIAHEIGHSWLYGILANDERSHPWLDEGLNTFLEKQYISRYHPDYKETYLPGVLKTKGSMSEYDAMQHSLQFSGRLLPPASDPQVQSGFQYGFSAYELPAQGLEMLMSIEGPERMQQMLRRYYTDHQFTHVSPEDIMQSFESTCDCELTWFFEQWINHAHEVDYRIKKFNKAVKEITITNKGEAIIPVKINTYKDGRPVMEHWLNGFSGEKIIHLDDRADEVRLYDGFMGINKHWTTNIKPRPVMPRIGFLPKVESYDAPTLSITPVFGYNLADGFMPGIAFTSGLFPQQHFKFVVAPMYGLESKEFRGHATFRYVANLDQGPFDKFLLSLTFDDFAYNLDTDYLFRDHYFRWEPSMAFRVQPHDENDHLTQWYKYRYVHIDQYYGRGINVEEGLYAEEHRNYGVHELLFQMRSDVVLKPFEALANIQAGKGFVRLNLQYKQHFVGKDRKRGIWVRGYGGWLPVLDDPVAAVGFTFNGTASNGYYSRDYMYDQWLGGRNAESGRFAHQVFEKDAGLKTLATIGVGERWMLGGGMSAALPFKWIHFYMDAALYDSGIEEKTVLSYSGGAAIVLWKDVFEIYIPFLESKDILESSSYQVRDMWFDRVSFQANIKFGNPLNLIDRPQLGY